MDNDGAATSALRVAADPTRTRILQIIDAAPGGRERVGELAARLGLRQPTVSHHMAALHSGGLVERQREGRRVWYSVHPEARDRLRVLLDAPAAAYEPDWDRVIDGLVERYRGTFGRETISDQVAQSRTLLAERGLTTLLASRAAALAAERLDDIARAADHADGAPTVLFVCVRNAGRSQMAAGLMRQLAGGRVRVRTAGSSPANSVQSDVVSVLDEIGVGLRDEFPKPLTDDAVRAADVVVTMGCGDACPVYPGRRYLDWELEDPATLGVDDIRTVRDDIDRRVRRLLVELGVTVDEKDPRPL
ncbi:metalloregulator ArsR/SmtB family transcription factor [Microbacterium koreense]|uniref:Metalloregulator ArsR/SmtB family transcription factor n=1 Tax=Microbacterium koreense TaxID=323761 RepID=A0ABW2ZTH3_9MICO